jgi:hypothetical protein
MIKFKKASRREGANKPRIIGFFTFAKQGSANGKKTSNMRGVIKEDLRKEND